jgi:hypothetical protein
VIEITSDNIEIEEKEGNVEMVENLQPTKITSLDDKTKLI